MPDVPIEAAPDEHRMLSRPARSEVSKLDARAQRQPHPAQLDQQPKHAHERGRRSAVNVSALERRRRKHDQHRQLRIDSPAQLLARRTVLRIVAHDQIRKPKARVCRQVRDHVAMLPEVRRDTESQRNRADHRHQENRRLHEVQREPANEMRLLDRRRDRVRQQHRRRRLQPAGRLALRLNPVMSTVIRHHCHFRRCDAYDQSDELAPPPCSRLAAGCSLLQFAKKET